MISCNRKLNINGFLIFLGQGFMKSLSKYLWSPTQCWTLGITARDGLRFTLPSGNWVDRPRPWGPGEEVGSIPTIADVVSFQGPPLLIPGKVVRNASSLLFIKKDSVSMDVSTAFTLLMQTLMWAGSGCSQLPEDREQRSQGVCTQ